MERSLIGHTDKKSTAYTWAKKNRDGGAQNVTVTKGDDGFYTVERDLFTAEDYTVEEIQDVGVPAPLTPVYPGEEEWTIPTRDYGAGHDARAKMNEMRDVMNALEKAIKEADAGIRWREKHGPAAVLPTWRAKRESLELTLAEATAARDAALAEAEVLEAAAEQEFQAFWERLDAKVLPQVAGRAENSDLHIQPTGEGGYRIRLTTGKVLEGRDGQDYPETAFGYESEVRSGFRWGRDPQPVTVHWGSYSGMTTPQDARTMIHVYDAAIELAMLVNGLLGLGTEGVDR